MPDISPGMILFGLGILAVLLILWYFFREAFADYTNVDMADECGMRTSCGTCLKVDRTFVDEVADTAEKCSAKGGTFDTATKTCKVRRFTDFLVESATTKTLCDNERGTFDTTTNKCTVRRFGMVEDKPATTKEACDEKGGSFDATKKQCTLTRYGTCGWCPNAKGKGLGMCVPKVGSTTISSGVSTMYPVLPKKEGTNEPLYTCPLYEKVTVDGKETQVQEFVAYAYQCKDYDCGLLKTCRDCAGNVKCGWYQNPIDATKSVCMQRKDPYSADPQSTDTTVNTKGDTGAYLNYITNTVKCPYQACDKITDCAECAATPKCGYCVEDKKCLKIEKDTPDETLTQCSKGAGIPTTSPFQCPDQLPDSLLSGKISEDDLSKGVEPTKGQLTTIQSNIFGTDTSDLTDAIQNKYKGLDIPKPKEDENDNISAPGEVRPRGSTSEKDTYPPAVDLSTDRPFEKYISMLVRSELAGQGVPTNEPFAPF